LSDQLILDSFADFRSRSAALPFAPLRPRYWLSVTVAGSGHAAFTTDGWAGLIDTLPDLPRGVYHVRRVGSDDVLVVVTRSWDGWEMRSFFPSR
jgi:hypothetical protein